MNFKICLLFNFFIFVPLFQNTLTIPARCYDNSWNSVFPQPWEYSQYTFRYHDNETDCVFERVWGKGCLSPYDPDNCFQSYEACLDLCVPTKRKCINNITSLPERCHTNYEPNLALPNYRHEMYRYHPNKSDCVKEFVWGIAFNPSYDSLNYFKKYDVCIDTCVPTKRICRDNLNG